MKSFYRIAITLILGSFATVASAQDLASVVDNCNGCHGDDGISQWTDVPTIGGMPEFTHADALYFFRDGDATLEDLALYYFELPFVAAQQDFDAGLAATGKAVHDKLCEKCHSDGGSNAEDEAGILAGQWMGYLEATFAEYAAGDRDQDKSMKEKMDELSADDTKALLHFYASQQ